jgi:hypothetical protein
MDLAKRRLAREASAREWTERAHGRSGATEPVATRGPGYSIDPHADGNERADDVITVLGPDGTLVHAPLRLQDGANENDGRALAESRYGQNHDT